MNRLKQLREEKDLKQEDIAKLLHVEIAAISKYETGRVQLKDEYIKILSNFFNVTSDYLLGITDIRNQDDEIQIAFSNGFSGLNEENKKLALDIIASIKAKQDLENK